MITAGDPDEILSIIDDNQLVPPAKTTADKSGYHSNNTRKVKPVVVAMKETDYHHDVVQFFQTLQNNLTFSEHHSPQ